MSVCRFFSTLLTMYSVICTHTVVSTYESFDSYQSIFATRRQRDEIGSTTRHVCITVGHESLSMRYSNCLRPSRREDRRRVAARRRRASRLAREPILKAMLPAMNLRLETIHDARRRRKRSIVERSVVLIARSPHVRAVRARESSQQTRLRRTVIIRVRAETREASLENSHGSATSIHSRAATKKLRNLTVRVFSSRSRRMTIDSSSVRSIMRSLPGDTGVIHRQRSARFSLSLSLATAANETILHSRDGCA